MPNTKSIRLTTKTNNHPSNLYFFKINDNTPLKIDKIIKYIPKVNDKIFTILKGLTITKTPKIIAKIATNIFKVNNELFPLVKNSKASKIPKTIKNKPIIIPVTSSARTGFKYI